MENLSSTDKQFVTLIIRIVEKNLNDESYSIEALAKDAGLSRSMLHRKLKSLTGMSTGDFITEIRLKKAKTLLESNVATVSEVAYKVGFSDPSYFTKVFKKRYNMLPGDIRKNIIAGTYKPKKEEVLPGLGKDRTKKTRTLRYAIIVLLLVIISITGIYYIFGIGRPAERSIAVLPLHNLTGDPENAFLIDGIQDELIGELGRIKSIRVISRTSTLRYRESKMLLPDIAKELGVNTIVEGSIHCLGDSLCLVIQLMDVAPKERHLLVNEYRDELPNVLKVQKTVVKDIAQKIKIKLTEDQEQLLVKSNKVNPEAYKDYLRGLYYLNQGTYESYHIGIDYMQKVIKRDPGDPFANGGLAMGYAMLGHGMINSKDAFKSAEIAANKALKVDPNQDDAFTALAMLYLYNFWNLTKSKEAFENALAINPNNVTAHEHYAWYYVLFNNKERTLYHARTATVIEPLSPGLYGYLGWLSYYFEEYEQAKTAALKSLELMENHPVGNIVLGWTYLQKKQYQKAIEIHEKLPLQFSIFKYILAYTYIHSGYRDKALALYNELEEEAKKQWVNPFDRGMLAGMLGFNDQAYELLNEACEQKIFPTSYVNVMIPNADFLTGDPRYYALQKKMDLPEIRPIIASKQTDK